LDPSNVDSDDDEMWFESDEQDGRFVDVPEVGGGLSGSSSFLKDYFNGIWDNIDDLSSDSGDENLACQYQESHGDGVQLGKKNRPQILSSECIDEPEDNDNELKTIEGNTPLGDHDPSAKKDNEMQMLSCTAYSELEPEASATSLKNVETVVFTTESQQETVSNDLQLSAQM
jgi:hypothetical protein